MNKKELKEAVALADELRANGSPIDGIDCFDGYGLKDFGKVYCSLKQVANLIRWQAGQLFWREDGDNDRFQDGWDWEQINEIGSIGRTKFIIVG